MRIDAHHHFWRYNSVEFDWIDDAMQAIRRDFLPADLIPEISDAGVVTVQARQSDAETRWLLELADRHDWIKGVVGWGPAAIEHPKLKGWRHVVQAEPDGFLLGKEFNQRIAASNLVYDILIHERQLPEAIQFVDAHPTKKFVLDHLGKPRIRSGQLDPWRTHLRELARRPNVFCKVSGMVTEADYRAWTEAQLRPFFEVALEAFGPGRLMFGSDWPVCRVACSYAEWQRVVAGWIAALTPAEQLAILGGTATNVYRL